jgi:uncharacterized protein (DUF1778 family)
MRIITKEQARFDAKLPKEQKQLFEKAALLGGYRNLTDFIILTVQKKAQEIIQEHEQILESQRDCEVFFEAITNPQKSNTLLRQALEEYKKRFSK